MNTKTNNDILSTEAINNVQFNDLFDHQSIQRLQDMFSDATGVASIITFPDGSPITNPTNFCKLCDIIRNTEKGRVNCYKSDAVIGRKNTSGSNKQQCMSGGLWDAGASITVGGKHIANWLIGQVRHSEFDKTHMVQYADEIGANREDFIEALKEVPVMSVEQFDKVSKMLFAFANELSEKAYTNWQLKLQNAELEKATKLLEESQKSLSRQNSLFTSLLKNLPIGVFMIEVPSGKPLIANEAAYKLLGRGILPNASIQNLSEIYQAYKIGDHIPYPPDEMNIILGMGGEFSHIDNMMIERPNGTQIRLEIFGSPVMDDQGQIWASIVNFFDITERKQVEEALRKSEAIQNKMVANISDVIVVIDQHGINRYKSPNIEKLFGWSQVELIGKSAWDNIHPNDFEYAMKFISTLANKPNATGTTECRYRCKNGIYKWIEFSVINLMDDPDIHGYLGTYHDITERRQSEEELLASERFLKETQIIAGLGTYTLEIRSGKWASSEILDNILGITSDYDKTYESWISIIHPDWMEIMNEYFTHHILGNKSNFNKEYKIIRLNDNAERWVHGIGNLKFDDNNQPIYMVGTIRDITERKLIENELTLAKEKAEESDKLKTAFLNNISHEIRTPFNGILGFLSLLQENDLIESERDEYIDIINKSAFRLMNTINDIVEVSQIQSGQIKLKLSETNIRKLTSGVYSHYKSEAESKGLKFFISNNLPINIDSIYTDSIKLNSILTILIGNAIKFTQTGSIEFSIGKNHEQIEFSVKDTGIGIYKNKLEAIFERFMQGDVSNTRSYDGSGLGLSIAKAYVEMLDGNIWAESEEGKGSHFYFTIPDKSIIEEKFIMKNIGSGNTPENNNKTLKILIAEDNEESSILLEKTIEKFSKSIIKVSTGIEAIEVCRNNPDIDLVLMDIKMPDIDGYEATRQIRKFNAGMVIIAQTAYAMTGDREKAMEAGCNDYITKPINKEKLLMLVQKYFTK